ncbi:hypothetical protein NDA18_004467 [Ustilago nuda]|nr:hypothetical protein NDA18_004467 [Ustilago nuda]
MVDTMVKPPANAISPHEPTRPAHEGGHPSSNDNDRDDVTTRQHFASIASRFGGLAAQASSQAASTAQKGTEAVADAGQQVAKATMATRNAAASQSAGLLQAMALTTKNAFPKPDKEKDSNSSSGTSWYEYESPLHARRRIAEYESPLHARRRLAAIASQLGLATSSAKQAPSLLAALSLVPSSSSSHSSWSSSQSSERWATLSLPAYKNLPSQDGWPGCAWHVWGPGDQLGNINLLTESLVLRAAKEQIKVGRTVSLNWPIHLPAEPFFRRKAPDVLVGEDTNVPISDEILELNTQSGSQWDGFRHFGHMPLNVFYGGAERASIQNSSEDASPQPGDPKAWNTEEAKKRNALGIHHLAQHGICGRGVLLDVFEYLSHHGTDHVKRDDYPWSSWPQYGGGKGYDPRTGFRITVADLIATAKHQNVTFRRGDILLIRSGFTARYYSLTSAERADWSDPTPKNGKEGMEFAGVEQGEEMKEFMWDNHFAAVAGDSPAFEARPTKRGECMLHETFLAMWGMPIGELFDLEGLAKTCRKQGRWTFYFSSWPLNLFGGVASTANASATF